MISLQLVAFAAVREIVQKTRVAHLIHLVPSAPLFVTRDEEIILSAHFYMSHAVMMTPAMINSTRIAIFTYK